MGQPLTPVAIDGRDSTTGIRMTHLLQRIVAALAFVAGTTASGGSIGVGSAVAVHPRVLRIDPGASH